VDWLLLDRDDTILDDPGYLSDPEKVAFLPGAIEGLLAFHRAGWPLVVISNQSGLGRGLFTPADLDAVHRRFTDDLLAHGVTLSGLYFCPHAPGQSCLCRKPEPGLALQASQELGLALGQAVMVGDKDSDLEMGRRIGAAFVAQIAAKGQAPLACDGCFESLAELAQRLLGPGTSGLTA
jgi:histidinol-phosphate phosphatase family protein